MHPYFISKLFVTHCFLTLSRKYSFVNHYAVKNAPKNNMAHWHWRCQVSKTLSTENGWIWHRYTFLSPWICFIPYALRDNSWTNISRKVLVVSKFNTNRLQLHLQIIRYILIWQFYHRVNNGFSVLSSLHHSNGWRRHYSHCTPTRMQSKFVMDYWEKV